MPDGGTPNFEQTPKLPERDFEVPETGRAFEAHSTREEQSDVTAATPVLPAPSPAPSPAPVTRKDQMTNDVESILEEDLADTYSRMKPSLQIKFRKEGERVTGKLVAMVRGAKVKAREALALITGWLKMIPGVNHFFLIQEAKIKTDKIVALGAEEKLKRGAL